MDDKKPADEGRPSLGPDEDDGPLAEGGSEGRGFASKMLGDLARRALTTGIGAVFMSEGSLRQSLTDMKLPKEAMDYVVSQADKTKKEMISVIARETREFLGRLEIEKMVGRMMMGTTIEIETRIKIIPKEGGEGMAFALEKSETKMREADEETSTPRRSRKKKKSADDDDPGSDG